MVHISRKLEQREEPRLQSRHSDECKHPNQWPNVHPRETQLPHVLLCTQPVITNQYRKTMSWATWVSQETPQHSLLWMQRGEMVRGSVGKARGLEKNAISKEPGLEKVPLPSLSSSQQFREKLRGRLSASHRRPHCTFSGQARVDLPIQVLITGLDSMLVLSRLLTLILC